MKQPEEDIALSPGGRSMVELKRYELHLKSGKEVKQVSMSKNIYYCNFNITLYRNHCALTTRQSIMSAPLRHTLHPQELVQLHVPDMGVFSLTVL